MGKMAARALVDQAAHTGPITAGSFNVLIGGKPAARKGDPVTCSSHGVSSIIEGSASVFINGIPAARMGDKTSCGTPPQPPPAGPVGAPVDNNFWSIIPNDKLNSDGTIDNKFEDNLSIKAFEAHANREDKTKDGSYDYGTLGATVFEMNIKGDYEPLGKGNGGVGGNAGFSKYKGELKGGIYGSNGMYGAEGEGKASMMSGNAEGHFGKEGIYYQKHEVKGDIAYIEGKAEAKVLTGGSDSRYGFQSELSGDLGAAKADYEGQTDFFGIAKSKIKIGLMGGAGALGGKAGFYVDTDDYEISANIGGKIAAAIGIKADLEVTLSAKPFVNAYNSIKDFFFPPVVEGTILTGCPTVYIG